MKRNHEKRNMAGRIVCGMGWGLFLLWLCGPSALQAQAVYSCRFTVPDSLQRSMNGTSLEPNPFSVVYTITNIGLDAGSIRHVVLYYPQSLGVSMSTTSPNPQNFETRDTLQPGASTSYEWILGVDMRNTRRLVQLQVIAFDAQGNPLFCDRWMPVAATPLPTSIRAAEAAPCVTLYSNAPNPFTSRTEISFQLSRTGYLRLSVYNLLGEEVATLVDGVLPAGRHSAIFTPAALPPGMYFARLRAEARVLTRTLLLK